MNTFDERMEGASAFKEGFSSKEDVDARGI